MRWNSRWGVNEVADTSQEFDRGRKLPLYAAAEIPEVWLVDIPGKAIERHTNPVAGTHHETIRTGRGHPIHCSARCAPED